MPKWIVLALNKEKTRTTFCAIAESKLLKPILSSKALIKHTKRLLITFSIPIVTNHPVSVTSVLPKNREAPHI